MTAETCEDRLDRICEGSSGATCEAESDRMIAALGYEQRTGIASIDERPRSDKDLIRERRRTAVVTDQDRHIDSRNLAMREPSCAAVFLTYMPTCS